MQPLLTVEATNIFSLFICQSIFLFYIATLMILLNKAKDVEKSLKTS